jgi:hypothetical protein
MEHKAVLPGWMIMINARSINIITWGFIAILFIFGFFSHPTSDDFVYLLRGINDGIVGAVTGEYLQWGGRYTSTAIMAMVGLFLDLTTHFWVVSGFLILFLYLSFQLFFRGIARLSGDSYAPEAANLAFILYLLFIPRLDLAFYWMAGGVSYQIGNALFLIYLGILTAYFAQERTRSQEIRFGFGLGVMSVLIPGTNETLMAFHAVLTSAVSAYVFFSKRGSRITWGLILSLTVIMSLIVYLAPGNSARLGSIGEPQGHDLLLSFWVAISNAVKRLIIFIVFLYAMRRIISLDNFAEQCFPRLAAFVRSISPRQRIILLAIFIVILFVILLPAAWAKGREAPGRAQSLAYLMVTANWAFLTLLIATSKLSVQMDTFISNLPNFARQSLIGVVVLLLVGISNIPKLAHDVGILAEYDKEHDERYELIRSAVSRGDILVNIPPLHVQPKILYAKEIGKYPDYTNVMLGRYLGFEGSIVVNPEN